MKVQFCTDTIQPMAGWLRERKAGRAEETRLREILNMPDYQVEFQRYAMPGLPVCGISFEEAVDFFMHFDTKDFENPRLQHKRASFLAFYEELEDRLRKLELFTCLTSEDQLLVEQLLKNGLPEKTLTQIDDLNIILIVSIGNSMGWPFENYIDYDIANLNLFETREDFLHVTAHEIHHIYLGPMLGADGIRGGDFFLQNFAYEGLAVHFNNNQSTRMKPKKYPGRTFMMEQADMDFYEAHFDEIFARIRADHEQAKTMDTEAVSRMISEHYEIFEFMGRSIRQYPTYYFGCYLWGLVDLVYGKEKLFDAIADPPLFLELYNRAADEKYRL